MGRKSRILRHERERDPEVMTSTVPLYAREQSQILTSGAKDCRPHLRASAN